MGLILNVTHILIFHLIDIMSKLRSNAMVFGKSKKWGRKKKGKMKGAYTYVKKSADKRKSGK